MEYILHPILYIICPFLALLSFGVGLIALGKLLNENEDTGGIVIFYFSLGIIFSALFVYRIPIIY